MRRSAYASWRTLRSGKRVPHTHSSGRGLRATRSSSGTAHRPDLATKSRLMATPTVLSATSTHRFPLIRGPASSSSLMLRRKSASGEETLAQRSVLPRGRRGSRIQPLGHASAGQFAFTDSPQWRFLLGSEM